MKRVLTKRSTLVSAAAALLVVVGVSGYALTVGFGHTHAAPAYAAPHKVHLKGAQPTVRNGIQNKSGDMGGDADTAISTNPSLSALCQSYIGNTGVYNNPAPNVDQINNDAPVLAGSQKGCSAAQNETTIAVNPTNPKNLVSGTNDYRVFNAREGRNDGSGWAYTTTDGGATWANIELPGLTYQTGAVAGTALHDMDSAGDPAIAFGPNNTVYYANLVFSRLNNGSGVTVNVSHDGGLHWDAPVVVHTDGVNANGTPADTNFFNDKEWIGANPTTGDVYLTWTHFTYDASGNYTESPIVMSVSHDFGATWGAMHFVSTSLEQGAASGLVPYNQGSIPQVGIDGSVYVAYEGANCATLACNQAGDHDAVVVAKSTDGGATFANTEVAIDYDFPNNADVGRSTLTGENFRINSFPQMAIDPMTGRLYVTWADDRNGQYDASGNSVKTNGDVFVATSGDGSAWTQLYQIGTSADEVYPAVAAYNGRVVASFYTRAYDPNGTGLDFAFASATGLGNLKHTSVNRITTQTSNPAIQFVTIGAVSHKVLQGAFIGDYTAVAMGSDLVFHPSWTDFRGNPGVTAPNQDAYTQAIPLK